tara:strand:- start:140 stop:286 length:147 start_codon:yes stop_codon:yes gene_type:complete
MEAIRKAERNQRTILPVLKQPLDDGEREREIRREREREIEREIERDTI